MRSEQIGPGCRSASLSATTTSDPPLTPPAGTRELMHIDLVDESTFQLRSLRAANDLTINALPNGCIYSIEHRGILINQILASPLAGGVHRVYLRAHDGDAVRWTEIIGPRAASEFASSADRFVWSGAWLGVQYRCTCWLHPSGHAWFFHVDVENRTARPIHCDAIIVQDLGLATRAQVRNNELFTSQYIDHRAAKQPDAGHVLMSRQNLAQTNGVHPWLLQGCFPHASGFATDGFDFFGAGFRADGVPQALSRAVIGERVRQYEAAHTAIQGSVIEVRPSATESWSFFAHFVPDHAEPSSPDVDLARVSNVRSMRDDMRAALSNRTALAATSAGRSVFQTCELFAADELDGAGVEREFGGQRRHEEYCDGRLVSFFYGDDGRHVVLKAKELSVERPHGHVMRAGEGLTPDAELMSCACYAAGVFASQLSLGNTSLGKLLSATRDPLNLVRSSGLRVFVRHDASGAWQLLGVPSAFEMALDHCRWHYRRGGERITVTCRASETDPAFNYDVDVTGRPTELLICGEIAAGPAEYESRPRMSVDAARGRITVRPDAKSLLANAQPELVFHLVTPNADAVAAIGGDELLFDDGERRGLPYLALRTRPTTSFIFTFLGAVDDLRRAEDLCAKYETARDVDSSRTNFWPRISGGVRLTSTKSSEVSQIQDALTWFARDAVVHLSTPRGLEQANGGAWGVRDVCQGPVEFLLSYDHGDVLADVLRKLFAQQYHRRGDWPQWFMFPPFNSIQSPDAHGDVVIWPLKALCDYLEHANDAGFLRERLPYTDDESFRPTGESETVLEHVDRSLAKMRSDFLPGLSLPRYGEGDWDDSLQPADAHLRERMVSSWTSALMYQTLRRYAAALAHFGEAERAVTVDRLADEIEADFQRHLMPDGVVAGFAVFEGSPPRPVEYLLHPSDTRTGLRYRLIPMTRGILSGIFSNRQAAEHLELIREHLLFPDGARLMDRPTKYEGGRERTFRRSESAAFFGREIGLQYVHAHLRYAEALAMTGRADELWHALRVVNPISVTDVVKNARPRQRNCYFSSSDATFTDRYEAARDYDKLCRGEVPVDGGWRIYSSGPGIYTNLVIRHLFGLRRRFDCVEFDPVLPRQLDGTACELDWGGRRVRFEFSVRIGDWPRRITVNGVPLPTSPPAPNPYRPGGLCVPASDFAALLTQSVNLVQIEL